MDEITITDLSGRCIIGVNPDERREQQDVVVNLTLFVDLRPAGRSDDFKDAVDYRSIKKRVLGLVEASSYFLLEALAGAIADLCLAAPGVLRVRVRVDKPSALRFARSVGVTLERPWPGALTRAYVALGSNIHPAENVQAALRSLAGRARLVAVSTVYESEAEGRPGQPPFYNCVAAIETDLLPAVLKDRVLRVIEGELGRTRSGDKDAPRTIDLDLIAYGDGCGATADLTLPDPLIWERPFLAVPLAEVAPDLRLPGPAKPVKAIAAGMCTDSLRPLTEFTADIRRTPIFRAQDPDAPPATRRAPADRIRPSRRCR